jgi:uncharacterized SAM-binding protein YcdF (DUF218 family)
MSLNLRSALTLRNKAVPSSFYVLALILAILTGLLLLRLPISTGLANLLVYSEQPEKSDLIYVLAGDCFGKRVLLGAELGIRGYANRVILSGGKYQGSYQSDMAVTFAVEHGYPKGLFCPVRLKAKSTIEEAIELRPLFKRLRARRIILVTTNYHSRRAAVTFRLYLPDVHFLSVAAPDETFDPASWWKTERGRRIVLSEYEKLAGTPLARLMPIRDWHNHPNADDQ